MAERIRRSTRAQATGADGRCVSITVSQGVATCEGTGSVDDVIASADVALYEAKDQGGDKVVPAQTKAGGPAPELEAAAP